MVAGNVILLHLHCLTTMSADPGGVAASSSKPLLPKKIILQLRTKTLGSARAEQTKRRDAGREVGGFIGSGM